MHFAIFVSAFPSAIRIRFIFYISIHIQNSISMLQDEMPNTNMYSIYVCRSFGQQVPQQMNILKKYKIKK